MSTFFKSFNTLLILIGFLCSSTVKSDLNSDYENIASELSITKPWTFTNAISVANTGSLELNIEPKKAMYLFTALGEKPWIPGWDPALIKGDGYNKGDVFAATLGTFYVVDFDIDNQRIFYTYNSPIEASSIEIKFESNGKGGSVVNVTWNNSALSKEGNAFLATFNQAAMEERMNGWKALITASRLKIDAFLTDINFDKK